MHIIICSLIGLSWDESDLLEVDHNPIKFKTDVVLFLLQIWEFRDVCYTIGIT
jgi:hypothetical protein